MTKRELLARIKRGSVSVVAEYPMTLYRVALSEGDSDPLGGVRIALADDTFAVSRPALAWAHVNGRDVPLTPPEIKNVARLVAQTMKQRQRPPHW